jgi:hypothetical protein
VPTDLRNRYRLYRVLRSVPENRRVRHRDAFTPTLWTLPGRYLRIAGANSPRRRAMFVEDLHLLHDVLAGSGLAGRYWVWSGLLLGWAREGRILPGDLDADLAYEAGDHERYVSAVPSLLQVGFRRWFSFRNNEGKVTEEVFVRRGAKFEFYRMPEVGGQREYYLYGIDADGPVQVTARLPRQELAPFEFLGRTWLKALDHEAELEAMYGDWRTPDPTFDYLHEHTIVARARWAPQR